MSATAVHNIEEPTPLIVSKSNFRSLVHRRATADFISVKRYAPDGAPIGETRFVGLFTADAYNRATDDIPLLRRKVTRDLLSGLMTVDFPRWTLKKEMPDIGQTHISEGLARYEIIDGDPLSAKIITDFRVELARNDTTITHHSHGTMTCDAKNFMIEMDLEILENGVSQFQRKWRERIKRDMV